MEGELRISKGGYFLYRFFAAFGKKYDNDYYYYCYYY